MGYFASKGAILAFTKALAAKPARDSMLVNTVRFGWVNASFNDSTMTYPGGYEALDAGCSETLHHWEDTYSTSCR